MTNLSIIATAELEARLAGVAAKRKDFIATISEGHDNGTPFDTEIAALGRELSERSIAAATDAFAAEWTVETFTARRSVWNTEAAKLPRDAKGVKWEAIRALEAKLGFTMEDLKRAKALLNIA